MKNRYYKLIWGLCTLACLSLLFICHSASHAFRSFLFTFGFFSCINTIAFDYYVKLEKEQDGQNRFNNALFVSIMLPIAALLAWIAFFTDFSQKTYAIISAVIIGGSSLYMLIATFRKKRCFKKD